MEQHYFYIFQVFVTFGLCGQICWSRSACVPGKTCQLACEGNCNLGCNAEGRCLAGCKPGWKGPKCDERCERFYFGPNCNQMCGQCRDDEPCDVRTGMCVRGCVPGWKGKLCDRPCEPYHYGLGCSFECGHCRLDKACNMVTGTCSAGCKPGWSSEKCDTKCPLGTYGIDCASTCGQCKGNETCDHVTGICEAGCENGWTGPKCNQKCTRGFYGSNCKHKCGMCSNGTCDHVTGSCPGGCGVGWQGTTCQEKCSSGKYGRNCQSVCGNCYKNVSCEVTGICTNGCQPGWKGLKCKENCHKGYYGHGCTYKCGRCRSPGSCNSTTGICPHGCQDGYIGSSCLEVSGKSMSSSLPDTIIPVLVSCIVILTLLFSATVIYFIFLRPRSGRFLSRFYRLTTRSLQEPEPHVYEQVLNGPWELNKYNLTLTTEKLGHGQFGLVKKGYVKKDRDHRVPVAVKSLKGTASEKDKNDFINELNILKKVGQHPNVVCLVGACHIQGTMYVAMEYAKNGDLRTYLRKIRKSKHSLYDNTRSISPVQHSVLLKFCLDVVSGLNHLADKQIIHRDVAARNVLLDENLIAKVADFGLSKHEDTYVKTSNTRVPVRWLAPESLFNATYTTQSDVWSFGILLWEVFTLGGTPYHGLETQQMCNLLKQGFRLRRPKKCEPPMYAMMLQCWNERPESRPQFSELFLRLQRMLEDSQVYMNLDSTEGNQYAEIDSVRPMRD